MHKNNDYFDYIYQTGNTSKTIRTKAPGDDLIPLNPNDALIINKISDFVSKYSLEYLHDAILPRSLFGIESDFVSKNQSKVKPYEDGDSFDEKTEIKLFTNDKAGTARRARWYIANRDVITHNQEYIDEIQVVVSKSPSQKFLLH